MLVFTVMALVSARPIRVSKGIQLFLSVAPSNDVFGLSVVLYYHAAAAALHGHHLVTVLHSPIRCHSVYQIG